MEFNRELYSSLGYYGLSYNFIESFHSIEILSSTETFCEGLEVSGTAYRFCKELESLQFKTSLEEGFHYKTTTMFSEDSYTGG